MNHDPMCPFFYDHTGRELVRQTGNRCVYCDLIARVREDERKFGIAPEDAAGWGEGYAYHCGKDNGFLAGYDAALRDAAESVDKVAADMANWSSPETADALEAFPELTAEQWIWAQRGVYRSIAAIESLGGEGLHNE